MTTNGSLVPFLRWAGGKQRLVARLRAFLPTDRASRLYVEPFLGAASLFLSITPSRARLSDANPHLIDVYRSIRDSPDQIAKYLAYHKRRDSARYYYHIRGLYNHQRPSAARSARFIYLNRTCFNGIFRVNKDDIFNVPYGYLKAPRFPSANHLRNISHVLRTATIERQCFREALRNIPTRSFVYLDPPYPPLSDTAYFAHYTSTRFSDTDHEALATIATRLHARGVRVMITNADTPDIRRLYRDFRLTAIQIPRWVSCKGRRLRVRELVIRNY